MKLYLGYYEKEINDENDNQPIGIILSEEKDDIMVEYAVLNDTCQPRHLSLTRFTTLLGFFIGKNTSLPFCI